MQTKQDEIFRLLAQFPYNIENLSFKLQIREFTYSKIFHYNINLIKFYKDFFGGRFLTLRSILLWKWCKIHLKEILINKYF